MSSAPNQAALLASGVMNFRNGWFDKAAECFAEAVRVDPQSGPARLCLGSTLVKLGRLDDARHALDQVSASNAGPALGAAWSDLGLALRIDDRIDQAASAFGKAVETAPDDALAQQRLGVVLLLLNRPDEAVGPLGQAVSLDPRSAEAWHNYGIALTALRRTDEAIAAFTSALAINPGHLQALAQRLFLLARECEWDALEPDLPKVAMLGIEGPAVSPFLLLSFEDHPERHRRRSERYVAALNLPATPPAARPTRRPDKLRIGYFSADFRNHAMVHLAGRIFELHDRERFTVRAYAFGPPSDDYARQRMRLAFDSFVEVQQLSDHDIAAAGRADGLDLAVDLMGYTEGSRLGIFAHRAAPLQIGFLGYPGTTGAPFIDYMIADPTVVPADMGNAYSERLIRVPFAYMPSDDTRLIAARTLSREQAGLPADGFVFCCFNSSYKIKPVEFAIWMRLLAEVADSMLWLLAPSARAQRNLRNATAGHGVDPARLVFAPPLPTAQHLARQKLADLFVDTFHYNAHTTASDALWAGLPLVTKAGSGFATRVAASLLHAIGCDELVTGSDEEYFELALDLARNPVRLARIRETLAANRRTAPLFDSAGFTHSIEAGYEAAYQRLIDGLEPADIGVSA